MVEFKVVKTESTCKKLWEAFSPKELLWDVWEARRPFHIAQFRFYFIVGYVRGKAVGLLPLMYDTVEQVHTFFGDMFPEQNRLFLSDKKYYEDFMDAAPADTQLYYMRPEEAEHYEFSEGEKRYFLNMKKYDHSVDTYFSSFTKKHRKNLRYDLRKVQEQGYVVKPAQLADTYDQMVKLNIEQFGEESTYADDESHIESMKGLFEFAEREKMLDVFTISKDGKIYGIAMGVIYNKCYYVLGLGRDISVSNIGKLINYTHIQHAIDAGCDEIDFLSTESKWKELWNFDSEQMYEYYPE